MSIRARRAFTPLYLLTALGGIACGDGDPTGPRDGGAMTFSYAGTSGIVGTGTFSASGEFDPNRPSPFVLGDVEDGDLDLLGLSLVDDEISFVALNLSALSPGMYSCTPTSCPVAMTVAVAFAYRLSSNSIENGVDCPLTTSTITITSRRDTRVVGTFSGSGACSSSAGGDFGTIAVTGGTFDVDAVGFPEEGQ